MRPIKIAKIRFCEECNQGQFNRANLLGYICSTQLAFKGFPYRWRAHMVMDVEVEVGVHAFALEYLATFRDAGGTGYVEYRGEAKGMTPALKEPDAMLIATPFDWSVREVGTLDLQIAMNGEIAAPQTFKVIAGESTFLAKPVPIGLSGIVTEGDPSFASDLCACAAKALTIVDCYVRPTVLATVLRDVGSDVAIRVIADQRYMGAFQEELPVLRLVHGRIEVRFAKEFHDRFLILDSTEHYAVGHSLNRLDGKRVWNYQKLMKREDIEKLNKRLAEVWENATRL